MKEYIIRIAVVCLFMIVLITGFVFATTSEVAALNNDMLAWGFRRGKNNEQPVLDTQSLNVLKEFNGYSMGNKESKKVYLTFDSGYEAGYTDKILDILKDNNITATFFITAHYLNTADNLVMKMIKNGNTVGNHTVNHKCLVDLDDEQYVVLLPVAEEGQEEEGEVVILKLEDNDDEESEEESYVSVDDEDTLNRVFDIFKEKFKDEFNFIDED